METPTGKPEPTGAPSPPLSEAQCHCVLVVALAYARRNGIQGEDSEDQALDFLLHLLLYLRSHPQADRSLVLSPAWLARSTDNWMKNCLRARTRRAHRETAWPGADEEALPQCASACDEALPDILAVRQEFHTRVRTGVALLSPSHRALFSGYIEQERSAADLAHASGRTVNAVHQAIWAMRRQLRQILVAAGLDEAEIREYLYAFRQYRRPT